MTGDTHQHGTLRWYCRCESFGCGKRRNDEDGLRPTGSYLGSELELREHKRQDKRRRLLEANGDPADVVNTPVESQSANIIFVDGTSTQAEIQSLDSNVFVSEEILSSSHVNDEDRGLEPIDPNAADGVSTVLDQYKDLFEIYRDTTLAYPTSTTHFNKYICERLIRYENVLGSFIEKVADLKVSSLIHVTQKNDLIAAVNAELSRLNGTRVSLLDLYIDTSRHKYAVQHLKNANPIILGCHLLLSILYLNGSTSMEDAKFLSQAVKDLIKISFKFFRSRSASDSMYDKFLMSIGKDIRTVLKHLHLSPVTKTYISCLECFCCYLADSSVTNCTFKKWNPKLNKSVPCANSLFKTKFKDGKSYRVPRQEYVYHSLREWIGELLWRQGMEDFLEQDVFADLSSLNGAMKDFWHGRVAKEFSGPDGNLFMGKYGSECRLLFSLSMDGFNPFQNKQAKRKCSVGGIYMICLNLPPAIRYNPENIFLVGIIPGPGTPSLNEINHMFRPVVDDLLPLWDTGIYYSETPKHSAGRLIRCAVALVVCDLPAARQISGFASHSASQFCSYCYITDAEIDDIVPAELRSGEKQRAYAQDWLAAKDGKPKSDLFTLHAQRYPEIHRLPYLDTVRFVVLDPMHSLLLGNLHRHCEEVWGMGSKMKDGDGEDNTTSSAARATVPQDIIQNALSIVKGGTLKEYKKLSQAVLSRVARMMQLRYGGSKAQLVEILRRHRIDRNWFQTDDQIHPENSGIISAADYVSDKMSTEQSKALSAEYAELAFSDEDLMELQRPHVEDACEVKLGLKSADVKYVTKEDLIGRLAAWRLENGYGGDSSFAKKARARKILHKLKNEESVVLGKDTLSEVWKDMDRTILPGWLPSAPSRVGDGKHGKLTADQWRTWCTVHLVITMIRLWGGEPRDSRYYLMLVNFMHLVTAVKAATMRVMTSERITLYEENMRSYLQGLIQLFPGVALAPNQHLSMHIPSMLEDYGPTHSWRSFAVERFNYLLQQTMTNRKFGELEKTLTNHFCMKQNLWHLMRADCIPEPLKQLSEAFDKHCRAVNKGTLLNDISFFRSAENLEHLAEQKTGQKKRREEHLKEPLTSLLKEHLEGKTQGKIEKIREIAELCKSISLNGITYATHAASFRNCNVIVGDIRSGERWHACRIEKIFTHTANPNEDHVVTYLVTRRYKVLSTSDSVHDPYRIFQSAGGRLFYDDLDDKLHLVEAVDIVCQFAITPYVSNKITAKCVHILPIDRD